MTTALIGQCRRRDLRPRVGGGCVVLWWTGRIDNAAELAGDGADGEAANPAMFARSVYARHGLDGLRKIVGDWSVVIRDDRQGAIVLASDFAGVQPLYYCCGQDDLRWSAGLGALRHGIAERCDDHFIGGFIALGGCPGRTPFEHIRSVPPGKAVRITRQSASIHTFWSEGGLLGSASAGPSPDEQFRRLFRDAVAVRLNTPGTTIAELSGGWDSSAVVCVADSLIHDGVVPATGLATLSYVHEHSGDLPYIDEIERRRRQAGTHLSTAALPLFSAAVASSDLPGGVTPLQRAAAAVATRYRSAAFLTGQGGDLVCANWIDDSLQVARLVRTGRLGAACAEALSWSEATGVPVHGILASALAESLPRVLRIPLRRWWDGSAQHESRTVSLHPAFIGRSGIADFDDVFSTEWQSAPPERRRQLRELTIARELRALQAPEPLRHVGYTHPFFHRPLVEFLMRVPVDMLCAPGEPRRLMRRALGHLLPRALRSRRSKSLFGGPMLQAFAPFAAALLKTREWNVVARGWVDRASLQGRLERLTRGLPCHETQLRQILRLESWLCQAGQATLR